MSIDDLAVASGTLVLYYQNSGNFCKDSFGGLQIFESPGIMRAAGRYPFEPSWANIVLGYP